MQIRNEMDTIPDWHVWDLKSASTAFLLPRLKAFREHTAQGRFLAIPTWMGLDHGEGDQDHEALRKKWVAALDEMILAFQLIQAPSEFEHVPIQEQAVLKARGLRLFAEYFEHLWD